MQQHHVRHAYTMSIYPYSTYTQSDIIIGMMHYLFKTDIQRMLLSRLYCLLSGFP